MGPSPRGAEDAGRLRVAVAGEPMSLPAGTVREVLRHRPVTRVPNAPPSLVGIANLRGSVLPVVSLARLLGRSDAAPTAASRVVVMDGAAPFGLLVDAVTALGGDDEAKPVDPVPLLGREFGALARRPATIGRELPAAEPAAPSAGGTADNLVLIGFVLAGQDYALPIDKVATVARLPAEAALLPRAGVATLGAIAFRGGLLPLVSPHALLGLPMSQVDRARARIIVAQLGAASVGLVVDEVSAILRLAESAVDPVPPVLTRSAGEARVEAIGRLQGGQRLVSILSPARLFDDETTARIIADATGEGTDMGEEQRALGAGEQFIVFRLGDEHYGLPVAAVDEVARRPDSLTRVPRAPAYLEGVMSLRGVVIPVISQRQRFAAGGEAARRGGRIVVVTVEGLRAGFAVDEVTEVLAVDPAELAPAPDLAAGASPIFDRVATLRRDGRMILLIDPKALLDSAERDLLAGLTASARELATARGGANPAARPAP